MRRAGSGRAEWRLCFRNTRILCPAERSRSPCPNPALCFRNTKSPVPTQLASAAWGGTNSARSSSRGRFSVGRWDRRCTAFTTAVKTIGTKWRSFSSRPSSSSGSALLGRGVDGRPSSTSSSAASRRGLVPGPATSTWSRTPCASGSAWRSPAIPRFCCCCSHRPSRFWSAPPAVKRCVLWLPRSCRARPDRGTWAISGHRRSDCSARGASAA